MPGKRALQNPRSPDKNIPRDGDLESGFEGKNKNLKRRFPRFKDAVDFTMDERMTSLLKKQLKVGVDIDEFERYRKSEEEVGFNHIPCCLALKDLPSMYRSRTLRTRKSVNSTSTRTND
jgi:hypothetical protein